MPTPPPALKVLDMRLADFAWDFAWLARLCVFRMSGSDMGHRAVRVLAPFRAEKEESSLDEGDGEGKEREEEWEGGVNLNGELGPGLELERTINPRRSARGSGRRRRGRMDHPPAALRATRATRVCAAPMPICVPVPPATFLPVALAILPPPPRLPCPGRRCPR